MDLKHLETFVHVIDNRSFTKTAEQLYLTQPTVSIHIAALEQELNKKLIIRTSKEVYPSEAGLILLRHAKQLLSTHDTALMEVRGLKQVLQGTITIGTSSIPGQYLLPDLLTEFRNKHPNVIFQVSSFDSALTIKKLIFKEIEIGFTGTMFASSNCEYKNFANDQLTLIAPNTDMYQEIMQRQDPLDTLLKCPFITRRSGSGTRVESENLLKKLGYDVNKLNIAAELQDTESIKNLVIRGLGVSIVSRYAVEDYVRFKKLLCFSLDAEYCMRPLFLVRLKPNILTEPSQAFFDYASHYYYIKNSCF